MQSQFNLRNQLLIAMPGMNDPVFEHGVTLICQHDDKGAFGIMINRPTDMEMGSLLEQLNIDVQDDDIAKTHALIGGPVQSDQGFILHDSDRRWDSTMAITNDLAITSSKDILVDIAHHKGPENFLLILGCSGWEAGQLEEEIKENIWLTCPASPQIIFERPYDKRWHDAAASLGIDIHLLGTQAGHA